MNDQLALDDTADSGSLEGRGQELLVRADQIDKLTWKQYQDIRKRLIDLGLPEEVASTTPWLAADPQTMIDQLKRPRREVLAPGVTGITLQLDVLLAPLIRAPENLRMGEKRYNGGFKLPRYGSTPQNTACSFDLSGHDDREAALHFLFDGLDQIDGEIDANNRYGKDIKENGVHAGGILFPLMISLPEQPWLGGWETADCYGRTYFVQESEGIKAGHVLEWLRTVPTDATELRAHPLQQRRAKLLSIAGKVRGDQPLTAHERSTLMRAAMPNTKIVLTVDGYVRIDEARRRLVAQQHLDRPTEFTTDTEWQTRAEAVLEALQRKDMLATVPGAGAVQVRAWLDNPSKAADEGHHADDIAMLAVSSLLREPKEPEDRVISAALKTRGVTGSARSQARSELTARVVARAIPDGGREGRRSALERVLQMKELRELTVDTREVDQILADARSELMDAAKERSKGTRPPVGLATRQIMVRAGFYLTCGVGNAEPLLQRSAHGAGKGQAHEPGELLRKLATTLPGLEQLAQVVFDGRRGHPVRVVEQDDQARAYPAPAEEEERLSNDLLRGLALAQADTITNRTASGLVAEDTDVIRDQVGRLESRVEEMSQRRDEAATLTHVEDHGWKDHHNSVDQLKGITKKLEMWSMLHEVKNLNPSSKVGGD